jgi:hypothetical protein
MVDTTHRHVAIWIDLYQAVLLVFDVAPLQSSMTDRPNGRWSQLRVDAGQFLHLQHYYEAVLSLLEPQDEILILGPDQAKRELLWRIEGCQGERGKVVGIHEASQLSGVDLVYPTGEEWRAEDDDGRRAVALASKPDSETGGTLGRLP